MLFAYGSVRVVGCAKSCKLAIQAKVVNFLPGRFYSKPLKIDSYDNNV